MNWWLTNWWGGYAIGATLAYLTTAGFFWLYWWLLPWQDDDEQSGVVGDTTREMP